MYNVGCFSSICVGGYVFPSLVIQNLWVCTIASLQECAARNELHRLLHQCMRRWLCVSCLRKSESVDVLSSLIGTNVQRRLLQQYMCGGLCVSCLRNSKSVGVLSSLPARNVQWRLLQQCLWGGLCFSSFVIQNLWVC